MADRVVFVLATFGLLAVLANSVSADPCLVNGKPCSNGGRCYQDENSGSFCVCPGNYYGPNCENAVPFCLLPHSQCQNGGKCVLAGGGYQSYCDCPNPYYGETCQYEVKPDPFCSVPGRCKNNGHCIREGDGYPAMCLCRPPFTGKYCEQTM